MHLLQLANIITLASASPPQAGSGRQFEVAVTVLMSHLPIQGVCNTYQRKTVDIASLARPTASGSPEVFMEGLDESLSLVYQGVNLRCGGDLGVPEEAGIDSLDDPVEVDFAAGDVRILFSSRGFGRTEASVREGGRPAETLLDRLDGMLRKAPKDVSNPYLWADDRDAEALAHSVARGPPTECAVRVGKLASSKLPEADAALRALVTMVDSCAPHAAGALNDDELCTDLVRDIEAGLIRDEDSARIEALSLSRAEFPESWSPCLDGGLPRLVALAEDRDRERAFTAELTRPINWMVLAVSAGGVSAVLRTFSRTGRCRSCGSDRWIRTTDWGLWLFLKSAGFVFGQLGWHGRTGSAKMEVCGSCRRPWDDTAPGALGWLAAAFSGLACLGVLVLGLLAAGSFLS